MVPWRQLAQVTLGSCITICASGRAIPDFQQLLSVCSLPSSLSLILPLPVSPSPSLLYSLLYSIVSAHAQNSEVFQVPLPNLRISSCVCLLSRMLRLSVSGLDLGSVVTSSWHLLLLGVASWILARILAWTYSFYENCSRLSCFPQPPKKNWFSGHLGMVSMAADRLGVPGCMCSLGIRKGLEPVAGRSKESYLGPYSHHNPTFIYLSFQVVLISLSLLPGTSLLWAILSAGLRIPQVPGYVS